LPAPNRDTGQTALCCALNLPSRLGPELLSAAVRPNHLPPLRETTRQDPLQAADAIR